MTIQESLEAEQKEHAATQEKLSKAGTDLQAALARAEAAENALKTATDAQGAIEAKVTALEGQVSTLTASTANLTEANTKLETQNKELSAKEQDIAKRANAQFREFAAAQGLNPEQAPKAGKSDKPGQGGTSTREQLMEQYAAITDPVARGQFAAQHEKVIFGRN